MLLEHEKTLFELRSKLKVYEEQEGQGGRPSGYKPEAKCKMLEEVIQIIQTTGVRV